MLLLGHQHGQPVTVIKPLHGGAVAAQGRQGDGELGRDMLVGLHQGAAVRHQGMHSLHRFQAVLGLGVRLVVGLAPVGPELLFAVARRLGLRQIQRHAADFDLARLAQQSGLDNRRQDADVVFGGFAPFALAGFLRIG
ncbi:hypothetical protein D3C79_812530 [compost metagenome]